MDKYYEEKETRKFDNVKRTPTVDNLDDIPTIDMNRYDKIVQEATQQESQVQVASPENNKISLSDLNPIDPKQFIKEQETPKPTLNNALFDSLDDALERTKRNTTNLLDDLLEEDQKEKFDNGEDFTNSAPQDIEYVRDTTPMFNDTFDIDEEEDTEEESGISNFNDFKKINNNFINDINSEEDEDDDIFSEDEENDEDKEEEVNYDTMSVEERQAHVDRLKDEVKENIVLFNNNINLSKYSIRKKPVSISKVMKLAGAQVNVADWVLPTAKRTISCSALNGYEITKLNPNNSGRNRLNTYKEIYNIIYNHVVDANKPDFETWLKSTYYFDIEHYYFALYKATFGSNNFVNRECDNPTCKHNFITDVKFEDMVTYESDEVKSEIAKIFRHDSTTKVDYIESDLLQISDHYAISIRIPSVWNVVIETASLSNSFLDKYADMIDLYSYIDDIFYIDTESEELIPIDYKPSENDQTKTITNKIRACYNIINQLTPDQYDAIYGYIRNIESKVTTIGYQLPEVKCPKCGKMIEAMESSADELLFIRHQLGIIAAS